MEFGDEFFITDIAMNQGIFSKVFINGYGKRNITIHFDIFRSDADDNLLSLVFRENLRLMIRDVKSEFIGCYFMITIDTVKDIHRRKTDKICYKKIGRVII